MNDAKTPVKPGREVVAVDGKSGVLAVQSCLCQCPQMADQGAMTSASDSKSKWNGEALASGNGSSAASGDQGTQGAHGDPSHKNAPEDSDNPKMHHVPQVVHVHTDTKAAGAKMQRHWAGQAQIVGDQEGIRREVHPRRARTRGTGDVDVMTLCMNVSASR